MGAGMVLESLAAALRVFPAEAAGAIETAGLLVMPETVAEGDVTGREA